MNVLSNLKPAHGSKHKRKVIGRGGAHGRSSTRGGKGQTARSGDASMKGFGGGQTPLVRLIPKRGFKNIFRKAHAIVNVGVLDNIFDENAEITPGHLIEKGVVKKSLPVKLLGGGEVRKKFVIRVHEFSASAAEKIKSAGGTIDGVKCKV